jgi:hypothetical protein
LIKKKVGKGTEYQIAMQNKEKVSTVQNSRMKQKFPDNAAF